MNLAELGIGFAASSVVFFITAGMASKHTSPAVALLIGVIAWITCAYCFTRCMKTGATQSKY
jgi:hypothetical protein